MQLALGIFHPSSYSAIIIDNKIVVSLTWKSFYVNGEFIKDKQSSTLTSI